MGLYQITARTCPSSFSASGVALKGFTKTEVVVHTAWNNHLNLMEYLK